MIHRHDLDGVSRRVFVTGALGTMASACLVSTAAASTGLEPSHGDHRRRGVQPAPIPIPGGLEASPGNVIHVFAPGDPSVTLPFTGFALGGFDVEPGTITDFNGRSAVAFHVGTATASDGKTYDLETDMRAFEGEYVVDGQRYWGQFAFV